ncbi:MAG: hypothetical protein E6733_00995 [Streptococcus parasanguinis]|uniref:hypothetical protein n=1 Tax=Leclercia adecarboxylata TaxID=83655 RepID=UPI00098156DA|nr:hypothetical protein [Leclercia adecarboxylata]MDU1983678.1 hypothetical protein [Streptococcus parasanguinis]OOB84791.1 hypothetical protein BZY71_22920 [Leclercia adecarboxylata]
MKIMLKAVFISHVHSILSRNLAPKLQLSALTSWGNLLWTDQDGNKQVEPLFSTSDHSPQTASNLRDRFKGWFDDALQAHQEALIAASGIKVGDIVFDKNTYHSRPVTAIRQGMIVLEDRVEVSLKDVICPTKRALTAEEKELEAILNSMPSNHEMVETLRNDTASINAADRDHSLMT